VHNFLLPDNKQRFMIPRERAWIYFCSRD